MNSKSSNEEIKVEPPIKRDFVKIKAIRVYIPELRKEVDSSIEKGESPSLLVKATFSKKRNENEIEVVFIGERHIEDLKYYKKDPNEWKTWGIIVLSPETAKNLGLLLLELSKDFRNIATYV